MLRLIVFIYFTKKQDNLGQELQCTIKVKEDLSKERNFQDAKNNVFKLIKAIPFKVRTQFISYEMCPGTSRYTGCHAPGCTVATPAQ